MKSLVLVVVAVWALIKDKRKAARLGLPMRGHLSTCVSSLLKMGRYIQKQVKSKVALLLIHYIKQSSNYSSHCSCYFTLFRWKQNSCHASMHKQVNLHVWLMYSIINQHSHSIICVYCPPSFVRFRFKTSLAHAVDKIPDVLLKRFHTHCRIFCRSYSHHLICSGLTGLTGLMFLN